MGLEPTTFGLEVQRAIQLRHEGNSIDHSNLEYVNSELELYIIQTQYLYIGLINQLRAAQPHFSLYLLFQTIQINII